MHGIPFGKHSILTIKTVIIVSAVQVLLTDCIHVVRNDHAQLFTGGNLSLLS